VDASTEDAGGGSLPSPKVEHAAANASAADRTADLLDRISTMIA
jgi:hypothetical protein